MSMVLSHKDGVKGRKQYRCCLCGEKIALGEIHDTRSGVDDGSMWTMRMHPECHSYEQKPGAVDEDWYENVMEPAFERAEAIEHANNLARRVEA